MILETIGTGSSGNCYVLTANNGERLILDCGVPIKEIKKGINWNVRDTSGCLCGHGHLDHAKSVKDLENIGIPVFAPYRGDNIARFRGRWVIKAIDMTDLDGNWVHTNGDGSPCPIYGFMVMHPEMGILLYITDAEFCKWKFKNVNHILLGVNYDKDLINLDDAKAKHVMKGHMSIDTACDFVKANCTDDLHNVIICHLSEGNADKDKFIEKMQKVAQNANVDVAEPHKTWILDKTDIVPF